MYERDTTPSEQSVFFHYTLSNLLGAVDVVMLTNPAATLDSNGDWTDLLAHGEITWHDEHCSIRCQTFEYTDPEADIDCMRLNLVYTTPGFDCELIVFQNREVQFDINLPATEGVIPTEIESRFISHSEYDPGFDRSIHGYSIEDIQRIVQEALQTFQSQN